MGLSNRLQSGYHIQVMVFGRHDQRIVATRAAAAGICAGHAASGQVQPERLENLDSTNWGVHHFW